MRAFRGSEHILAGPYNFKVLFEDETMVLRFRL